MEEKSAQPSGDRWIELENGRRVWGAFGAAGLLAHDPGRGILLQHRVGWSHHGGTWGIPGGARTANETAIEGALRESSEEAGVIPDGLEPIALDVLDLRGWTYTTVVAEVSVPFEPVMGDAESLELRWVEVDAVATYDLHPGFAAAWSRLHEQLGARPTVVVDAANVVGSRPDGWWRDREGAARRLLTRLERVRSVGVPGCWIESEMKRIWPRIVVVLERRASAALPTASPLSGLTQSGLRIVAAANDGDSTIIEIVRHGGQCSNRSDASSPFRGPADGRGQGAIAVVTADRELGRIVADAGAHVVGPRGLTEILDLAEGSQIAEVWSVPGPQPP